MTPFLVLPLLIDPLAVTGDAACTTSPDENAIVICGMPEAGDHWRIDPADRSKSMVPKALWQLSDDVSLAAEAEGAEIGGQQSNRAMVRLKIRF